MKSHLSGNDRHIIFLPIRCRHPPMPVSCQPHSDGLQDKLLPAGIAMEDNGLDSLFVFNNKSFHNLFLN